MSDEQIKNLQKYIDGEIALESLQVESAIKESIFVLRPDLAPEPKISFDEIWSSVHVTKTKELQTNPLDMRSDEEREHEEQREIEKNKHISLILDSSQAVPNVSIDDIFSSLTQGPLYQEQELEQENEQKEEEVSAEIISFPSTTEVEKKQEVEKNVVLDCLKGLKLKHLLQTIQKQRC